MPKTIHKRGSDDPPHHRRPRSSAEGSHRRRRRKTPWRPGLVSSKNKITMNTCVFRCIQNYLCTFTYILSLFTNFSLSLTNLYSAGCNHHVLLGWFAICIVYMNSMKLDFVQYLVQLWLRLLHIQPCVLNQLWLVCNVSCSYPAFKI